jgi:hypothetical protein
VIQGLQLPDTFLWPTGELGGNQSKDLT